jgi:hypothetical protein
VLDTLLPWAQAVLVVHITPLGVMDQLVFLVLLLLQVAVVVEQKL